MCTSHSLVTKKKKKKEKKWKWWLTLLASFRHRWKGSKERSLLQGKHLALWIRPWLSEECWTNLFLSKLCFFTCVVVMTPTLHLGQRIEPAVYGLHCVLPIDCEPHALERWCLLLLKMFTIYYVFFCLFVSAFSWQIIKAFLPPLCCPSLQGLSVWLWGSLWEIPFPQLS